MYVLLFFIGFVKHFLGYYLYFQQYFCNYKCTEHKKQKDQNDKKDQKEVTTPFAELLGESCIEGLACIGVGFVLLQIPYLRRKERVIFFLLGFILHIISELLGLHSYFCKKIVKMHNKSKLFFFFRRCRNRL
uniref:Uncharacterized protein n=1 Tax=viral metagenome TaxID=1070528 RepID=A0A6C0LEJ7_9ZZZZ